MGQRQGAEHLHSSLVPERGEGATGSQGGLRLVCVAGAWQGWGLGCPVDPSPMSLVSFEGCKAMGQWARPGRSMAPGGGSWSGVHQGPGGSLPVVGLWS